MRGFLTGFKIVLKPGQVFNHPKVSVGAKLTDGRRVLVLNYWGDRPVEEVFPEMERILSTIRLR